MYEVEGYFRTSSPYLMLDGFTVVDFKVLECNVCLLSYEILVRYVR